MRLLPGMRRPTNLFGKVPFRIKAQGRRWRSRCRHSLQSALARDAAIAWLRFRRGQLPRFLFRPNRCRFAFYIHFVRSEFTNNSGCDHTIVTHQTARRRTLSPKPLTGTITSTRPVEHETHSARPERNHRSHADSLQRARGRSSGKARAITTSARTSPRYCNASRVNRLLRS